MTFLETAAWTALMCGAASLFLAIMRQMTAMRRSKEVYREEMRLLRERLTAVRASRRKENR